MRGAVDLDHVAVAAETWDDLWPRYAGDLGGRWIAGGAAWGFASAQVRFANGMKLEALAPHAVERNDFLRRFLDHRGPGPHHLTFKVPDIAVALDRAAHAGYRPVGVDVSDPMWKEAFLHPKDAPGVVVQLAQAEGEWSSPPPDGFPAATTPPASLDYIGHAVADHSDGARLFAGLLDGEVTDEGDDDDLQAHWTQIEWPGPGRIRLLRPTDAEGAAGRWLGTERGRLHHLAFTVTAPEGVADAKPLDDGRYEIAPELNLGTRLLLSR